MTRFEDFVSTARAEDAAAPALVLPHGTGPEEAMRALGVVFGSDDDRENIRIVVGGVELGVVHRDTLLDLVQTSDKGFFGEGDALLPPGSPLNIAIAQFACPVPGCPSAPTLVVAYDEDDPPRCSIHPATALERVA